MKWYDRCHTSLHIEYMHVQFIVRAYMHIMRADTCSHTYIFNLSMQRFLSSI
jgi:hypothetical protein